MNAPLLALTPVRASCPPEVVHPFGRDSLAVSWQSRHAHRRRRPNVAHCYESIAEFIGKMSVS